MGGILSSPSTIITTEIPPINTKIEESKPTDTVHTTPTLAAETTQQAITEPSNETEITTTNVKTETKSEEVLERYVEPTGTKVEVAPVEVAPTADVVKKSKKKHKKHH